MRLTGKVHDNLKAFANDTVIVRPFKIPRVWVMVADHHVARIFLKTGKRLEAIGVAVPDQLGEIEITNESIGRAGSSGSSSIHHKYEPRMNSSRSESMWFINELSDWLDKVVEEDAFDQLVMAAPPQALGELRKALKPSVQARIIAELDKDLTKMDKLSLQDELGKTVWF